LQVEYELIEETKLNFEMFKILSEDLLKLMGDYFEEEGK
jgi:hypothetical protein